jgi:hypothetical protein
MFFTPVGQDHEGDEEGGHCVGPPQADPDPAHADDGTERGHPVGLVHVGVGVQHLVVQILGLLRQSGKGRCPTTEVVDGQLGAARRRP